MIYVTHDQVEAMTMADKIVVLQAGRVMQVGTPMELYHHPKSEFVAGFIGAPAMNFVDVTMENGSIRYGAHSLAAPGPAPGATRMGIRPEHMILCAVADGDIAAEVTLCETLGGDAYLYVRTDAGDTMVVRADGDTRLTPGDKVGLGLPIHRLHLFGPDGATLVSGSLRAGLGA